MTHIRAPSIVSLVVVAVVLVAASFETMHEVKLRGRLDLRNQSFRLEKNGSVNNQWVWTLTLTSSVYPILST